MTRDNAVRMSKTSTLRHLAFYLLAIPSIFICNYQWVGNFFILSDPLGYYNLNKLSTVLGECRKTLVTTYLVLNAQGWHSDLLTVCHKNKGKRSQTISRRLSLHSNNDRIQFVFKNGYYQTFRATSTSMSSFLRLTIRICIQDVFPQPLGPFSGGGGLAHPSTWQRKHCHSASI